MKNDIIKHAENVHEVLKANREKQLTELDYLTSVLIAISKIVVGKFMDEYKKGKTDMKSQGEFVKVLDVLARCQKSLAGTFKLLCGDVNTKTLEQLQEAMFQSGAPKTDVLNNLITSIKATEEQSNEESEE